MSGSNGHTNPSLDRRAIKARAQLQTQQLATQMISVRIQYLQLSPYDITILRSAAHRHGFAPTLNRMLGVIDPLR